MLAIHRAVPLALPLFCERHLELVADAAPFPGHRPPSRPNTPPPPGSGSHSRAIVAQPKMTGHRSSGACFSSWPPCSRSVTKH
ncbi:extensin [Iris pallida]|uniref:Extensin n=1 Tax=Iris pallida TaxID=29817 RepID=A0AAX6HMU2_IRIPA|nr:extensin [Iris pallida]